MIKERRYNNSMKIYIPHLFKNHDNFINIQLSVIFMLKPWYRKYKDEDIFIEHDYEIYDNYAGWLWFNCHWYSTK